MTSSVKLFIGTHKISSVITNSSFYLVERRNFDNYLIDQFKKSKGVVYEDRRICKIFQKEKKILLDDNTEILYKILVGADGANSQIRKLLDSAYHIKQKNNDFIMSEESKYICGSNYFSTGIANPFNNSLISQLYQYNAYLRLQEIKAICKSTFDLDMNMLVTYFSIIITLISSILGLIQILQF